MFILGLWRQAMRLVPFRLAPRLIGRRRAREQSAPEPNEKPTRRKRRRWWLQFSLRGLLVFTFLVAVGLSLWKIYLAPYYRQKRAMDELRRMGIEFHTQPGEGPRWVGWLVGEEDFVRVIRVIDRNRDHHYAGEELERLLNVFDRLRFVECISFRGDFTDADLVHLRDKDRLRGVTLRDSQIRGPGLRYLAAARHLKEARFSGSASFTDAGLEQLRNHKELEWLFLEGTRVTDEGLAVVRNFPRLRHLRLSDTRIGDAGVAELAGLHRLESLDLDRTRITDGGLAHLKRMRNLRFLWVANTAITAQGLGYLPETRHTLLVFAEGLPVTEDTLDQLRQLPAHTCVHVLGPRALLESAGVRRDGPGEGSGSVTGGSRVSGGSALRREVDQRDSF